MLDAVVGLSWLDCFTFSLEGTGPNSFLIRLGPVKVRIVNDKVEASCRDLKEEIREVRELANKVVELRRACGLSTLCSSSSGRIRLTVVEGVEEVPGSYFDALKLGLEVVYKKRVSLFLGSHRNEDLIYVLKAVRTKSDLLLQLFNPKAKAFWYVSLRELKSKYPEHFGLTV